MRHLNYYRNYHAEETCFILGNGPSLRTVDLSGLTDHITFGTNRVYLSGFVPTYYVCVNPLVLSQFGNEIAQLDTIKFISSGTKQSGGTPFENVNGECYFLDTGNPAPFFSDNILEPLWEGYTVTYVALQIAFFMGFGAAILIGVDHDFGELPGKPNQKVIGGDNAHFHPDYFKDAAWHLPDLRRSELAYSLASRAYQDNYRSVINASSRTKLKTFPLLPLNHILEPTAPRVSALVSAYKSEQLIDGCLEDLASQSLWGIDDMEAVIVCQRGTYEEKAAREFQLKHTAKVKVIVTEDCPSLYKAWNMATRHASGLYLTNANTDDRHHPNAYELMANYLDGAPHKDVVYADSYITWQPESFIDFVSHGYTELAPGREPGKPGIWQWPDYDRELLTQGCYIGPHPMWRHTLHQLHGPWDESYQVAGDFEFWLRVAGADNFYHLPLVLGLYAARADGLELRDPELTRAETVRAIAQHQAKQVTILDFGPDTKRLLVGGQYAIVDRTALEGALIAPSGKDGHA